MEKRNSVTNRNNWGCLFAIFELIYLGIFGLIISKNPLEKVIGWGLFGALVIFFILGVAGVPGMIALDIILLVAVFIGTAIVTSSQAENSSPKVNNRIAPLQVDEMEVSVKEETPAQTAPVKKTVSARKRIEKQFEYFSSIQEAVEQHNVPEGYSKILIEEIKQTDVKECPGLLWTQDNHLCVLPLRKDTAIFQWPLLRIPVILFKKIRCKNPGEKYLDIADNAIAEEFEELFPEYLYGENGTYTGKFILSIGLEVTNKSGKVLFERLQVPFHVVDDIAQSGKYDKAIRELYQQHLLWEQGIIDAGEYIQFREKCLAEYREREKDDKRYDSQISEAVKLRLM